MIKYYWHSMLQDFLWLVNHCEKCQIYAPFIHSSAELLHSVIFSWPFYQWGYDILIPFPLAATQLKFLIVVVDYFTKWVEAEALPRIMTEWVRQFYWRNIICRFGLPGIIISDKDTQFSCSSVVEFYKHLQANGQTKVENRIILSGMKIIYHTTLYFTTK